MAARNDGKDQTEPARAEKQGAEDQRPDALASEDTDALDTVQTVVDEETEQGYRGTPVDPTPNEHYTVAGVVAGLPTPESDPDLAAEVAGSATTKFNNK